MLDLRVVDAPAALLVLGRPFDDVIVRAIGEVAGQPILATCDARVGDWVGDPRLDKAPPVRVLKDMRNGFPEALR